MTTLTHGSLCSGYEGIGLALQHLFPTRLAWVSDIDKGARKVLAHRYPDVPNIGDMTVVDWATLEPVDILTAGYPCQPFSHAGNRKGTNDDRHLWPYVREAIRGLRPRLTILENVAGHRSLGFDRVLGDLAEDGMDVGWVSVRASDAGAPHRRERLFIAVVPAADAGRVPGEVPAAGGFAAVAEPAGYGDPRGAGLTLLPTPAVNDMGAAYTPDEWDAWTDRMKAEHGNGNGHGKSLSIEAQRLLPTPTTMDSAASGGGYNGATHVPEWGDYGAAIARWEQVTRPAPPPTEQSPKGQPRLSPAFTEWMMGLPAGWITDVPGITRNEALKLCGNGVVPQQAVVAIRHLLATIAECAA